MSRILGPAIHQAYVFPAFDAALRRFAAGGIGPFHILHSSGGVSRYRGEDHPLAASIAFFYSGDSCFEVITPHGEQQSAYAEFLRVNPAGGLHHIACHSADFAQTLATLDAEGMPMRIVQEFCDPATGNAFEIYCEPVDVDNPVLFQFIRPGLFDAWFDLMREAAWSWDGSAPIRDGRASMPGIKPEARAQADAMA